MVEETRGSSSAWVSWFVVGLSLGADAALNTILPLGPRVVNLIVSGSQKPTAESRSWMSLCKMLRVGIGLLIAKPVGTGSERLGRKPFMVAALFFGLVAYILSGMSVELKDKATLVVGAALMAFQGPSMWLPRVILADLREQLWDWYFYIRVGQSVLAMTIALSVGLTTAYTALPLSSFYWAAGGLFGALLFLALKFLPETLDKKSAAEQEQQSLCFLSSFEGIFRNRQVTMLLAVEFACFWASHTYSFDRDNFVNHHFHWTLLQSILLVCLQAGVNILNFVAFRKLSYSPKSFVIWGFAAKATGLVITTLSATVRSEQLLWTGAVLQACGDITEPILKVLLAQHGNVGDLFGALHTLKSTAGFLTALLMYFLKDELQETVRGSVVPGIHFLTAAGLLVLSLVLFCCTYREPEAAKPKLDDDDPDSQLPHISI